MQISTIMSETQDVRFRFQSSNHQTQKAGADRIRNSESMNHALWPITQDVIGYYPNGDETKTFDQAVSRMITAYSEKLEWMDTTINRW